MILAVADAGPIIHLDEIDALSLLSVVDELLIPQTVYQELEAGTIPPALEPLSTNSSRATQPTLMSIWILVKQLHSQSHLNALQYS